MEIFNSRLFTSTELRRGSTILSLVIWMILVFTSFVLPWEVLVVLVVLGLLATTWTIFLYFRASLRRQHSIENSVERLEQHATVLGDLNESMGKLSVQSDAGIDLVQLMDVREQLTQVGRVSKDVPSLSDEQSGRSLVAEIRALLGMIPNGKALIICPSHEVENCVVAVNNYSKLLDSEIRAYDQPTPIFEIGQYSGVILLLPVDMETRRPVIPFSWIGRGSKIFVVGGDDSSVENLESLAFGSKVEFGSIRINENVRQLSILRNTGN